MTTIGLLTIGSELLDGRVQDTNSNFLCEELSAAGFSVKSILSCDDVLEEIVQAIEFLSTGVQTILITGGLGPTTDDLTREAVAAYTGKKLILDHNALENIKAFFEKRSRRFFKTNEKQAMLPESASLIPNPEGTAPGFQIEAKQSKSFIIALPGVPRELKRMFHDTVLPYLRAQNRQETPPSRHILKVFGLPESLIGERIESLKFAQEITVSYRAKFPQVDVVLKSKQSHLLSQAVSAAKNVLGVQYIFSESPAESFEEVIHHLLLQRRGTLAVAESCTGGLLGKLITNSSGSSQYFRGGVISYSDQAKMELLGVESETLSVHGAVSGPTAKQMAEGAKTRFHSDLALSITGIAGPEGGSSEKPVGTFFIGFAAPGILEAFHFVYPSHRERVRNYSAFSALDILRRYLAQLPLPTAENTHYFLSLSKA